MAIPDYQRVMLPLLRLMSDGRERHLSEVIEVISNHFELSPEERSRPLPSGRTLYVRSRCGWARTYLKKAGLLFYPRRGFIAITDRGRQVLQNPPNRIDITFLEQFPEFVAFRQIRREPSTPDNEFETISSTATPEETLDSAYERLRLELEEDILEIRRGLY